MLNRLMLLFALPVLVAGCTMVPKYSRPDMPVAASWPSGDAYHMTGTAGKAAADTAWEEYFQSAPLKKLIKRALENNRDLRVAALNIERAAAAYRIQKTNLLPTVNAGASGARTGTPENISATGKSYTSNLFKANVGVTAYELDFFGRLRSLNQAALEQYMATKEAKTGVRISLIAEVSSAYCTYLADKELLKLANETYEAQQKTYDVIQKKYKLGSGTQMDVSRAEGQVKSAKTAVIQYTRAMAQAKNAITFLAGTSVDDILNSAGTLDTLKFMGNLPAGIPSKVLTARPDIMQAEHNLKAANADIGAARAALYPSITLTGTFGVASTDLDTLFASGSRYAWNFTPAISIPIFNRGRLKATLETAKVNEKIAATQYEKALQTAFREVADQLAARGTYKQELETQQSLVDTTKNTFRLANLRYENGVDSYLTVLDAQRSLFSAQQKEVAVKQQYLINLVTLYKVLGGGQI